MADQWGLAWPLGLEWRNLRLSGPNFPSLQMDRVQVSLVPGSLLKGTPSFDGKVEIKAGPDKVGQVLTRATLQSWSSPLLSHLTGSAQRLDLVRLGIPSIKKGQLQVEFEQHWRDGVDEGHLQVELVDLQLDAIPIGTAMFPAVSVSSLKGRMQCRSGTCRFEGLEGRGPDGTLSGAGTLILRNPVSQSELAMTVTVTASPELAQRAAAAGLPVVSANLPMTINLRGPVARPQLSL
jgi:type II secretion system protein N